MFNFINVCKIENVIFFREFYYKQSKYSLFIERDKINRKLVFKIKQNSKQSPVNKPIYFLMTFACDYNRLIAMLKNSVTMYPEKIPVCLHSWTGKIPV